MTRDPKLAAAVVLVTLVCGSVAAGCGGGGGGTKATNTAAAAHRAELRWRAGLTRWSESMVGALNAISVLFSDAHSVDLLQRGETRTSARLTALERRLATCSAEVSKLGPPPKSLEPAQRSAFAACTSLERGSRQVRDGVADWQNGLTPDGINRASDMLGAGQDGIARARAQLRAPVG